MPARRSGLGRGLEALIPPAPPADPQSAGAPGASPAGSPGTPAGSSAGSVVGTVPVAPAPGSAAPSAPEHGLREVPIDDVEPNRYQPRGTFVDDDMDELTESVREMGVLQPLLVRRAGPDRYELIAGERRWRAARAAGLSTVPVVVRDADDRAALEEALVENLQRSDLNALDEAVAYQQLVDEFGLTQEAVATRVGKRRSTVTNMLRLLSLPREVQEHVRAGRLSPGHGRALAGLADPARQAALAESAIAGHWSVRQIEEAVAADGPVRSPARRVRKPHPASAAVLELEQVLGDALDTRVRVHMAGGGARDVKGRLVVEFAGLDDLERVFRRIAEGPPVPDPD